MEVFEKSTTVDPEVRAYVYSLVNAVGGQSTYDDTYSVGDDALAALNDILRWLRLYDEKLNRFDVKRCLAEAALLKNDLLEILALWPEEAAENKHKAKLALSCLQLMVPLTWPLELEDDKTTVNHHRHLPYLQLAQVGYKRAVLHYEHARILRTAVRVGLPNMGVERRERSKRDEGIIKLVLYLFRNMAMITQPQMLPSQGDENEISRSATISVFREQDVFNLLLTIGSGANDEFQDQDVILLEILFHLLKGVDAHKLFLEKEEVQHEEANELRGLMAKEKAMHKSYNKHAPSRHNRFGTMLWVKRDEGKMSTVTGQNSIVDGEGTLMQMDQSKKWNKPRYRGKNAQQQASEQHTDFAEKVDLTETARKHLKTFVEDFVDSGFNPLFSSLRKAIERETDRVGEVHKRQYFYLIHWFLSAETARRRAQQQRRQIGSQAEENTFAYIAAVLDQETFVLLNRHMQRSFDEKSWTDLQATLLTFTQILLTVQTMAESPDEEDQEIAENIQNRIFYEEATHDRIVQILRGYANQGFGYLDTVTECVHVFVRMLEKYSKMNADLQIRSKRRQRRRKKQQSQSGGNADDDAEQDQEDEREVHAAASERKFDFARFSAKFLSQPCVDTFISLLHYYEDLSSDQLKRCHRYLYRLAFKHDLVILLFRVDILLLLHRMIKGPATLNTAMEGYKDWETLIQQVFRRCVKWMEKDTAGDGWKEVCMTEMLFSKVPNTVFFLQNGFERVVEKRAPRPPAEVEFKGGVDEGMRLPVVVSLLVEQSKSDELEWVKREMERAMQERDAWENERAARAEVEAGGDGGEEAAAEAGEKPAPPSIFLSPDTDERKTQLFKDKFLRLLLTTLGFERLGTAEDLDAAWIIPSEVSTEQLKEALETIKKTEFDPPSFDDGKGAADMLRNKSAARRSTAAFDSADDDDGAVSGSGGDIDDSLFPPNLREQRKDQAERPKKRRRLTKRNHTELTDAQVDERAAERRRKEKERNSKIKSALYVSALDDESDEEADAEFFRLEEERRLKQRGVVRSAMAAEMEGRGVEEDGGGKKGKKRKGKGNGAAGKKIRKRKQVDGEDEAAGDSDASSPPPPKRRVIDSDEDDLRREMNDHLGELFDDADMPDASSEIEGFEIVRRRRRTLWTPDPVDEDDDGSDREAGEDEEGTPSTSPPAPKTAEKAGEGMPLGEVSGNVSAGGAVMDVGMESDEDDAPMVKPVARRNIRAGFIVDDSDSE